MERTRVIAGRPKKPEASESDGFLAGLCAMIVCISTARGDPQQIVQSPSSKNLGQVRQSRATCT